MQSKVYCMTEQDGCSFLFEYCLYGWTEVIVMSRFLFFVQLYPLFNESLSYDCIAHCGTDFNCGCSKSYRR